MSDKVSANQQKVPIRDRFVANQHKVPVRQRFVANLHKVPVRTRAVANQHRVAVRDKSVANLCHDGDVEGRRCLVVERRSESQRPSKWRLEFEVILYTHYSDITGGIIKKVITQSYPIHTALGTHREDRNKEAVYIKRDSEILTTD